MQLVSAIQYLQIKINKLQSYDVMCLLLLRICCFYGCNVFIVVHAVSKTFHLLVPVSVATKYSGNTGNDLS